MRKCYNLFIDISEDTATNEQEKSLIKDEGPSAVSCNQFRKSTLYIYLFLCICVNAFQAWDMIIFIYLAWHQPVAGFKNNQEATGPEFVEYFRNS